MTRLITVDEAKARLNVDHDLSDDDIDLMIQEASAQVLDYIGDAQYLFLDTGGDDLVLDEATDQAGLRARQMARKATFLLVGDAFKSRESAPLDPVDPMAGYGYMPRAVVAVLFPLRIPTAI